MEVNSKPKKQLSQLRLILRGNEKYLPKAMISEEVFWRENDVLHTGGQTTDYSDYQEALAAFNALVEKWSNDLK